MNDSREDWIPSKHKQHMTPFQANLTKVLDSNLTAFKQPPRELSIVRHLKLFRLFGSTPLSLEPPNFSNISKPAMSITMLVAILNSVHLLDPSVDWRKPGKFTKFLAYFTDGIFIVSPFLITFKALQNRFQLENTLNSIIQIQRRLGLSGYKLYGSTAIMGLMFIVAMVGFVLFRIVVIYFTSDKSLIWVWDDIMWIVFYTYMFSNLLKVTYLLKCISHCFQRLSNTYLGGDRSRESIVGFVKTYSQLVDIVGELNGVFDVAVTTCILNTYFVTLEMSTEVFTGFNLDWWDQLWFYAWFLIPIIGSGYIFQTCHKLTHQAEECSEKMVNSIIFHNSEIVQSHPLVMVHLSGKKTVAFKSCDCFIIDYSFAISMIAGFLTYLVILYQMEKDASSHLAKGALLSNSST